MTRKTTKSRRAGVSRAKRAEYVPSDKLIAARRASSSVREAAEKLGMNPSTVMNRLVRLQKKGVDLGNMVTHRPRLTREDVARLSRVAHGKEQPRG